MPRMIILVALASFTAAANATVLMDHDFHSGTGPWTVLETGDQQMRWQLIDGTVIIDNTGSGNNQSIIFATPLNTSGFKDIFVSLRVRASSIATPFEAADFMRLQGYAASPPESGGQAIVELSTEGQWNASNQPQKDPFFSFETALGTYSWNNPSLWLAFEVNTSDSTERLIFARFTVTGNPIPNDIVVNSLDDPGVPADGLTTLREAISQANNGGNYTINFAPALTGGTIRPTSQLPEITGGAITIEGDINDDGQPDLEINGSLAGNASGLVVTSSGNVISGIVVNSFMGSGIVLFGPGASQNAISSCYVGTDKTGSLSSGNKAQGVDVVGGAFANTIGPGNLISGNDISGILIAGVAVSENLIIGNRIGTDSAGQFALPNGHQGIDLCGTSQVRIGGIDNADRNIISGNAHTGIHVGACGGQEAAHSNTISGNYVGTNASGTVPLSNGLYGIVIDEASDGNIVGPANIISGNTHMGLLLAGSATNNLIHENLIGTNASGAAAIPNGAPGIIISGNAAHNTVGPENVVSGNNSQGIVLDGSAHQNHVVANRIGTDRNGQQSIPNFWDGIVVQGSAHDNIIGGGNQGNLISGNRASGVLLRNGATQNKIFGNIIGLNDGGTSVLGNRAHGVDIWASSFANTVGGMGEGERNIISGNGRQDIWGSGVAISGSTDNQVVGNFIGTDLTGTFDLGNGGYGIEVGAGATNNEIGPANIISGNCDRTFSAGNVSLVGAGTTNNQVHDNYIGLNLSGLTPVESPAGATYSHGVLVDSGATENMIGPRNVISGNTGDGVRLRGLGTNENIVLGNLIGTDGSGSNALPNETGIQIDEGARRNIIGGTTQLVPFPTRFYDFFLA